MFNRRLTPTAACVMGVLPVVLAACAGQMKGATRSGDVESSAAAAPASGVSGVVPATPRALPDGMVIDAQLDQALTAATPEGYAFSTKVTQAVAAKDGGVAIPAGTVVRGVVTGIRAGSPTTKPVICLNLDFLELKGRSYPIRSSVEAVLVNGTRATTLSRDSVPELFPKESAGPPPGTPVVLAAADTAGKTLELPIGTTLVIKLDSAIAIQR